MKTPQQHRIQWVVDGVTGDAASGWASQLASNRYRAILPAQELLRQGHRVSLIAAPRWHVGLEQDIPDAVVIGKLLSGNDEARFHQLSAQLIGQIGAATANGIPVLGDFNDDHFEHPLLGEHWRTLAQVVSMCVVGSDAMVERLRQFTDRPVRVIGDPIGSPAAEPRVFNRSSRLPRWATPFMRRAGKPPLLKFAWYGNPVNWRYMQAWAERLVSLAADQPFAIWAVTTPRDEREREAIERFTEQFNLKNGPNAMIECTAWDEATQWSVVADADIVLIPSNASDPKKAVKTSNRLTDALNAGRFVIASPLPAYAPYGEHVAITDDPVEAAQIYLREPDKSFAMIRTGQALARSIAGDMAIGKAWLEAVRSAAAAQRPAKARESVKTTSLDEGSMPPTATPSRRLEDIHRTKKSKVSDKWQSYFAFYDKVFAEFRDRPISLLEIGVQNGGSLEVWSEYFAHATAIVGCDIEPRCASLKYDDPRVSIVVGDANLNEVATRIHAICPSYDIVIDDGSHLSDDIINSFLRYFGAVKPGGIYVIEDMHTMYRESHGGGVLRRTTATEFFKLVVDLLNYQFWQKDLSLKTLFSTFAGPGPLTDVLQAGWVDGIEFRNSLICVRKAASPTHNKLGDRVISGVESLVAKPSGQANAT